MFDVATKGSEAPSLKDAGLADGIQGSSIGGSIASMGGGQPVQRKASDIASGGFSGGGSELPHRKEMEESFGQDFSGVKAHTDGKAQSASRELGAHAYAVGDNIAFGSANPDKALVAHELTHVAQARNGGGGGPAMKSDAGIDTSGEAEAEQVEAAVKAGKPARSALAGGVATGGGPALKSGKGIARSAHGEESKFTSGLSFSKEGMEKTSEWQLWKAHTKANIPGTPINVGLESKVRLIGAIGANWAHKAFEANLTVLGNVSGEITSGIPDLAEIYGALEMKAEGGFKYRKFGGEAHAPAEGGHEGGGDHATAAPEASHHEGATKAGGHPALPKSWDLNGAIWLSTNFRVGAKLGGGIIDWGFDFGKIEFGRLTGLSWKDGHFDSEAVGWEWGPQMLEFFAAMKTYIAKAKALKAQGEAAFNNAIQGAKQAGQVMFSAGQQAMNWVSSW